MSRILTLDSSRASVGAMPTFAGKEEIMNTRAQESVRKELVQQLRKQKDILGARTWEPQMKEKSLTTSYGRKSFTTFVRSWRTPASPKRVS